MVAVRLKQRIGTYIIFVVGHGCGIAVSYASVLW